MALITCAECGVQVSDKAKACPKCGCPVVAPVNCPECGTASTGDAKSCTACGCPLTHEPPAAPAAPPAAQGFQAVYGPPHQQPNYAQPMQHPGYGYGPPMPVQQPQPVRKQGTSGFALFAIIVLAIVVGVVLLWLV